uniref:RNA1 polyprotein n=1 Tax=Lettuce nepovirus TaxID=3115770 RepID=A0AAT9J7V2_9SECO
MGFYCPSVTCPLRERRWSRNQVKEDGNQGRCLCCDSLLQWEVPATPAPKQGVAKCVCWRLPIAKCPKHGSTVPSGRQVPQTSSANADAPTSAPSAPLEKRVHQDVVVTVGPPANLTFIYPSRVQKVSAPVVPPPVKSEDRIEVPVPIFAAPLWLKKMPAPPAKEPSLLPPWLISVRKLFKLAIRDVRSLENAILRLQGLKLKDMKFLLQFLAAKRPCSKEFNRVVKAHSLKVLSIWEGALAQRAKRKQRNQELRAARRVVACRKARLALQRERAALALARQEFVHQSSAGLYAVRLFPRHKVETTAVSPKPTNRASPKRGEKVLDESIFDWDSLEILRPATTVAERSGRAPERPDIGKAHNRGRSFCPRWAFNNAAVDPRAAELLDESFYLFGSKTTGAYSVEIAREILFMRKHIFGGCKEEAAMFLKNMCELQAIYGCDYLEGFDGDVLANEALLKEALKNSTEELRAFKDISSEVVANGLINWCKESARAIKRGCFDIVDYTASAVRSSVDYTMNAQERTARAILGQIRALFDSYVSGFMDKIVDIKSMMNALWDKCLAWALNMLERADCALRALGRAALYAVCILTSLCIVSVVDNLLCRLGIISTTGVFTSFFLTACLAAFAWKVGKTACEVGQELFVSVRVILLTVLYPQAAAMSRATPPSPGTVAQHMVSPTARTEAVMRDHAVYEFQRRMREEGGIPSGPLDANGLLDTPLDLLNSIGKGIFSFKLGTLQYLAKWGQALDQIKRGRDAFWELASWLIEGIGIAYEKATGVETAYFKDLAATTAIDIPGWISRSTLELRKVNSFEVTSDDVKNNLEKLLAEGDKIRIGLGAMKRSLSSNFSQTVASIMRELGDAHKKCVCMGHFDGYRFRPFWIYLHGKPQCGKSMAMNVIRDEMLSHCNWSPNSYYAKGPIDKYWSGYQRQHIVTIDDLSAVKNTTSIPVEQEMILLVSSNDHRLTIAEMEGKGMHFTSEMIISSSNVWNAPTDAELLDVDAYKMRRRVLAHVQRGNGEFDPDNPLGNTLINLQDPVTGIDISPQMSVSAFIDAMKTEWDMYSYEQSCIKARIVGTPKYASNDLREAAKILHQEISTTTTYIGDDYLERRGIPRGPEKNDRYWQYFAVDGKIYGVTMALEAHELEFDVEKAGDAADYIEGLTRKFLGTWFFHHADKIDECAVIRARLRELVSGHSHVNSVDIISSSDPTTQEFFLAQPLAERVVLRIWQKNLDEYSDLSETFPFLKNTWWSKVMDGMDKAREFIWENSSVFILAASIILCLFFFIKFFALAVALFTGSRSAAEVMIGVRDLDANASPPTHKRGEGKYGMRHIPTSYKPAPLNHNVQPASTEKWGDASQLLVVLQGPMELMISAMIFKNRSILLCKHQAMAIAEGAQIRLSYFGQKGPPRVVYHTWSKANIFEWPGHEIVRYSSPTLSPLPAPLKSWFLDDYESQLPQQFDCFVTVFRPRPSPKDYYSADVGPSKVTWETVAMVVHSMQDIKLDQIGYYRTLPRYIHTCAPGQDADCGGIYVTRIQGRNVVVGMHVAGNDQRSVADLIPIVQEVEANGLIYSPVFDPDYSHEGIDLIGTLPPALSPQNPTRNHYVEVPIEKRVRFTNECDKVPSVLTADDPRLEEYGRAGEDPIVRGLEKYYDPMLEVPQDLLDECAKEVVQNWRDLLGTDKYLYDASLDEALNGHPGESDDVKSLVKTTSEGYPFILERNIKNKEKGKMRYVVPDPHDCNKVVLKPETSVHRAYVELKKTMKENIPELVCIECPKDELLKPTKKTRLFSILPMHFNIVYRELFLNFVAFLQCHRKTLPCQVGINPYSLEWHELFSRLATKSTRAYNCDYSRFDGLLSCQMINTIGNMINMLYASDVVDPESNNISRWNMLMAIYRRKSLVRLGRPRKIKAISEDGVEVLVSANPNSADVYEVAAGMPSGFALTVIINSIFNELLIRMAFKVRCNDFIERPIFDDVVSLVVYGDDNLIAVHPAYDDRFTGEFIKDYLAGLRITITDGIDKTSRYLLPRPLEEVNFLKRGFRVSSTGRVVAPLDRESIYSCMRWVEGKDTLNYDILFQNVQSCLEELWLHKEARAEFDEVRSFYLQVFPPMSGRRLHTWEKVERWHNEQAFAKTPLGAASLDVVVQPALRKMAMNQGNLHLKQLVVAHCFLAGPSYVAKSDEFLISMTEMRRDEKGIHVPYRFGTGYGDLPTNEWVKKFREKHIGFQLDEALKRGEKLVFRGMPPMFSPYLALSSYALSRQITSLPYLSTMAHEIWPGCVFLDFYFDKHTKQLVVDALGNYAAFFKLRTNLSHSDIFAPGLQFSSVERCAAPSCAPEGMGPLAIPRVGEIIIFVKFGLNKSWYDVVPECEIGTEVKVGAYVSMRCADRCTCHNSSFSYNAISDGGTDYLKWMVAGEKAGSCVDGNNLRRHPWMKPLHRVWSNRCPVIDAPTIHEQM